ncbi:neuroligin-4, X-linked-like [Galendromus occidentalis]|uniref:Neuroligin-4, X-linked-like n=1 Tax=Galendromus occidentalis TaxID=34638 RepID=A0AAJ7SDA0_9ACAR|nr:neuroligin-4, X-linked-like [Galendromus occidentalis]
MADRLAPVCPQKPPDVQDETAALKRMSQRRVEHLKHLTPFLTGNSEQQSEDCLYLNLYTPTIGDRKGNIATKNRLPVMVFIHGESFEWNSGNAYDGSVLASYGEVIVVTLNYRLGILGFLPPMESGGRGANNGLLDIVAALHWVQENVIEFGGDPGNVTVFGHGRGAALANLIMLTPMARGLIQRAILMSGSALSPWAMARDSVKYTKLIATELNCPLEDNRALIECLKSRSAEDIVAVGLSAGEYLTTFGPVVDGIAIPKEPSLLMEEHGPNALFKTYELLVGMADNEGGHYFSHLEEVYGIDGDQRKKHFRNLVRNLYSYHRQEIFVTVLNEYTDWTVSTAPKPSRIARETAEALGDALVVAPLVKTARLHAKLGGKSTFMYVSEHQQEYNDHSNAVLHENDLVYIFGAPLVESQLGPFVGNYTLADQTLAQTFIEYWTQFVKSGTPALVSSEPTEFPSNTQNIALDESQESFWPKYELSHQKHLVLGGKLEVDDHYHAHRLALWTNLIPLLHRPGGPEVDTLHHQLSDDETHSVMHPHLQHQSEGAIRHHHDAVHNAKDTTPTRSGFGFDSLLVRQGMPYASALGVTVAVGCSLLVLNALIFAAVYYQRDKTVKLLQKNGVRSKANDPTKQAVESEEGVRSSFRNKCPVQENKKSREIAQMESLCHSHSTTLCGHHQTHEMHECHEHQHLHQLTMSEVMNAPQV